MDSSSSSGNGGAVFALFTGAAALNAQVVASFQFGGNGVPSSGQSEYAVSSGPPRQAKNRAAGHVVWDPGYDGQNGGDMLFSVAPVRLRVNPKAVHWAVGTNRFIRCACEEYERIEKIQVVASAAGDGQDRIVQWDRLEVTFHHADGRRDTHHSDCLPKASTARPPRRSVAAKTRASQVLQQIAEIIPSGGHIVAVEVHGVVTLKAGDPRNRTTRLRPGELQGQVLVFTKPARRSRSAVKR